MHRVRFFDYMPSAIRDMEFNSRTQRLAVARANGAVEIVHFADNYFQEKVPAHLSGSGGLQAGYLCVAFYSCAVFSLGFMLIESVAMTLQSNNSCRGHTVRRVARSVTQKQPNSNSKPAQNPPNRV